MKRVLYALFLCLFAVMFISCDSDSTNGNTPPGVPQFPSPGDGATSVGNVTTLSWECEDEDGDNLTYSVYLGETEDMEVVATGLTEPSYQPEPMAYSTRYYWKVKASDGKDTTSSSRWRFNTVEEDVAPEVPNNPQPEDQIIDIAIDQTFRWYCYDINGDDVTYDFCLGKDEDPPVVAADLTAKEYEVLSLDYHTMYYWKVIAKSAGLVTEGPVWCFETKYHNYPPEIPEIPYPIDGADGISTVTRISWSCEDIEFDDLTYDIYLGTESNPSLIVQGHGSLTYYPEDLQPLTTYYWRIDAWDGNHYSHGPIWSFTTGEPNTAPNEPYMPWPQDGAVNESVEAMLRWSCSDPDGDELMYRVYFGTTEDLDQSDLIAIGITDETWELGNLDYNTTYYWKIVASDGDMTATGGVWSFTTESFDRKGN